LSPLPTSTFSFMFFPPILLLRKHGKLGGSMRSANCQQFSTQRAISHLPKGISGVYSPCLPRLCIRSIYRDVCGILGEDTDLPGSRHRFGPVGDIELAVDTGCMGFDGTRCDNELPGDLLVGSTQGHELENLQFALA
jgi:hypothetical protein